MAQGYVSNLQPKTGGVPLGYHPSDMMPPPQDPTPDSMNLRERVMHQHQRISLLEQQNHEIREAFDKLCNILVRDVGIVLE